MTHHFTRHINATGVGLVDMYLDYAAQLARLGEINILYEFTTHYPSDGITFQMNVELHYTQELHFEQPPFFTQKAA